MQKLPRPSRDQLIAWRLEGKTLQVVADEQDVSISLVKLWVHQLDAQTYGMTRPLHRRRLQPARRHPIPRSA